MKKLLFVFLASLVFFSCQKKEENANLTQDVVFSIDKIDPGNLLKSTVPPICPTDNEGNLLIPTYAEITITDGTTPIVYSPQVFELNGLLYTQVIKLPPGTYTVTDFLLYDVNDVLIMATPSYLGTYSEYVTKTVDFTFVVEDFTKTEIDVEVLCYLPEYHDYFGFVWFNITEIVLREFCFFGDICLNGDPFTPEDFNGSLYGTDLGIDVPAIMKIVVRNNGVEVPNSPFNNETTSLTGPLCLQYPDKLNVENEIFTFELWVWTRGCEGTFGYELFEIFTSTDDGELNVSDGGDGVLDFVVGTCGYEGTTSDVTYSHYDIIVKKDFWYVSNPTTNPDGFLFTNDFTTGKIYKWTRTNTAGYGNISAPIGRFLYEAGYQPEGLLGLEAVYYNANTELWSAHLGALMFAYNETALVYYSTQAETIMPTVIAKYHPTGTSPARDLYWGYDYFNILTGAKLANDNGVTGATAYLSDLVNDYTANYIAKATNDYHKIFINAIAVDLGIGTHQGFVTWIPWDGTTGEYGLQEAAYGLMGNSWANPDVVKAYIRANLCDCEYSEPLAEGIYSLGL